MLKLLYMTAFMHSRDDFQPLQKCRRETRGGTLFILVSKKQ